MNRQNIPAACSRAWLAQKRLPLLPPAAFAIIMGTGTLACATLAQSEAFPILEWPAWILCWLNLVLFACLTPFACLNWLSHKKELCCQCQLPAQEAFLSTIGIGLLVLAHQCLFFSLGFSWALIFWLAGTLVTLFLNFAILFKVFIGHHELGGITPVFFIPVVGLVVIPVAGCSLITQLPQPWSDIFLLVCLLALGAGLLLYSGLFAAMLQRHLLLEPIPDYLSPTLWIHLAPLGWGSISVLFAGKLLAPQTTLETLNFFAFLVWGAAGWWVIMAGILTIRALIHHGLYFSMAWWSFIFPLGAFAMLTKLLKMSFYIPISFTVWLAMALIWLIAALKTIAAVRQKFAF